MTLELCLVFVHEVDAIGHPDDNHQRGDQGHQQGDFVVQKRHGPQRPHDTHGHHHQAYSDHSHVAEEEEQQQRSHHQRRAHEIPELSFHLVGHGNPDERQAAQVGGNAVLGSPSVSECHDVFHDGAALRGVEHGVVEHHHHQRGVVVLVEQEALVEWQGTNRLNHFLGAGVGQRIRALAQQVWGHRRQQESLLGGVLFHLERIGEGEHGIDDGLGLAIHLHAERSDVLRELVPRQQPFRRVQPIILHSDQHHVALRPEGLEEAGMGHFHRVVRRQDAPMLVLHFQLGDLQPHEDRDNTQGQNQGEPVANQKGSNSKPHARVQRNDKRGRIPLREPYLCAPWKPTTSLSSEADQADTWPPSAAPNWACALHSLKSTPPSVGRA